jgi:hypothetical protein
MALESGTYINSLNAANPASTDGLGQADDHIRLIKSAIKATFPNLDGPVTATVANLNNTTAIPSALTDLGISDGSNGMVLSTDGSGNFSFVALPAGTTDTNNYVTGGSFSGTTLTLTRDGLSSVSISGFPQAITDNSQIGNGAGYITSAQPTSSQVGSATAGLSATTSVGAYAFLMRSTATTQSPASPNSTYSSSLLYTDRSASSSSSYTTSGTWKCMGYSLHLDRGTVWLRIA